MHFSIKGKYKYVLIVNIMFAIYSLTGVFGKFAAAEGALNFRSILFYIGLLCFMAIYAIMWQQVIKKLPLIVAYANKAVVVLWGLIWGMVFFDEEITTWKLVGIVMVMAGIVLFAGTEEGE